MGYLVQVPLEGGGTLTLQAPDDDVPGELELAAVPPGEVVVRTAKTLERALDELQPALASMLSRLVALAPQEVTVEFGIMLGAESGIVVAKGKGEVHFTVTLGWKPPE